MCLALAAVILMLAVRPGWADPGKILFSPHSGDATIVDVRGVNSDRAIVRFRRELDDEIEDCTRESGEGASPRQIANCARNGLAALGGRVFTRRAYCSASTLYTEFGNYSMVNHVSEPDAMVEGRVYRSVRTDWKDHVSGEIVGNCNACNTPQLIDTFKVLCPLFYESLFEGREPY